MKYRFRTWKVDPSASHYGFEFSRLHHDDGFTMRAVYFWFGRRVFRVSNEVE